MKFSFFLILVFGPIMGFYSAIGQGVTDLKPGQMAGQPGVKKVSDEEGLLFYLSGDKGFDADFVSGGQKSPNYLKAVKTIPDGKLGSGFQAGDNQLMSYWAYGNIYAQRGTVAFFWRSRHAIGSTPFPIFRVGYADHTSWDMVWLRIDYNGAGFDAFVTDVGLARTRVSYYPERLPEADEWVHIALSWDETDGIRFYINGKLVAKKTVEETVFDTGLDQFGPHSRIISPYQVQSLYNFVRGGDLDELRIYDRMLSDDNIGSLSRLEVPKEIPGIERDLNDLRWRNEWWLRNGWNLPNQPPALLTNINTTIRKVEVQNAYDVRRWSWKAFDGIRETTWPGVYNMSRLPGRYDYFVLPDWDAYSRSGQTLRVDLPDEKWNHIEMWGKAWGQLTYEKDHQYDNTFAVRTKNETKSYFTMPETQEGGKIRYDNALIEEPIGEMGVYYVHEGKAPVGNRNETFTLESAPDEIDNLSLKTISSFIDGRYPVDERAKMIGVRTNDSKKLRSGKGRNFLPFINVMIPYESNADEGLDGVEITLPPMAVKATHGDVFPMNIRIKDPLWLMRDLTDFSFSIEPDKGYKLWFDTRDRILPEGRGLYITISGAGADLDEDLLAGAKVRLVYKKKNDAKIEHAEDRLTQVRDLYGFSVEEGPALTHKLNHANRLIGDLDDLLKIDPDNWLGQAYRYVITRDIKNRPGYKIPEAPKGVPEWAYLQSEYLKGLAKVINFYIDERQISNGEFGGGLSDDDDFTNSFVGTALMGIEPEKTLNSVRLMMNAFYDQERDPYDASLKQRSLPLFTNGLATINTDQLHAYEDGIQAVGQMQLLDYGNPVDINHAMETTKRVYDYVTGINSKGHKHFKSRFFGGTWMSEDEPWVWSDGYSYNLLHNAYNLVKYNGNPLAKRLILELADGLLPHIVKNSLVHTEINFNTDTIDSIRGGGSATDQWQVFLAAYELSGNKKYLSPIEDKIKRPRVFDENAIVKRYTDRVKDLKAREFINTDGSVWIDRVVIPDNDLQEDRLGGVALTRIRNAYQQHNVSWKFKRQTEYSDVAIFLPLSDSNKINVISYNIGDKHIRADMSVWNITPGRWKISQGIDSNGDYKADSNKKEEIVDLERGDSITIDFLSHKYTIINLQLIEASSKSNDQRPDLGISKPGIKIEDNKVTVRVFSLGSVKTPPTKIELRDANGVVVSTQMISPVEAPLDLTPRWVDIKFELPVDVDLRHGIIQIDPGNEIDQITKLNDSVKW